MTPEAPKTESQEPTQPLITADQVPGSTTAEPAEATDPRTPVEVQPTPQQAAQAAEQGSGPVRSVTGVETLTQPEPSSDVINKTPLSS